MIFDVIGVDIYNFALTNDVGRCISTASGGLNEHIPLVIIVEIENDMDNRRENGSDLHPLRSGKRPCCERLQTATGGDL